MIQIFILFFFFFAAPELWIKRNSWAQVDNPWIIHHPVFSSRCRDPCADSCAFESPGGLGYNWETGFSYAKSYFISQTCASSSLRLRILSLMNSLTSSSFFALPFICFVRVAHTQSHPASPLLQKGIKHGEMFYIHPQKHVSLLPDVCCLRWMHIWLHRGELPHSALHQTGQKKPRVLQWPICFFILQEELGLH